MFRILSLMNRRILVTSRTKVLRSKECQTHLQQRMSTRPTLVVLGVCNRYILHHKGRDADLYRQHLSIQDRQCS